MVYDFFFISPSFAAGEAQITFILSYVLYEIPFDTSENPPNITARRSLGTADKNHLKEDITPLLPTGIRARYCETISYL
jgi:hypothetical protein